MKELERRRTKELIKKMQREIVRVNRNPKISRGWKDILISGPQAMIKDLQEQLKKGEVYNARRNT